MNKRSGNRRPDGKIEICGCVQGGNAPTMAKLAPKFSPHGLSIRSVGETIAKSTSEWKGYKVQYKIIINPHSRSFEIEIIPTTHILLIKTTNCRREKEGRYPIVLTQQKKEKTHDSPLGDFTIEDVLAVAREIRPRSLAKDMGGTVREVLGTVVSLHCTVDRLHPKQLQQRIKSGAIGITEKAELSEKIIPTLDWCGKMEKLRTSHSVVNILVPRSLWGPIQSLRTLYIKNSRCGPHFSFLDPFLDPFYFPVAADLLRRELANVSPFLVFLETFGYFRHSDTSFTIYLEPTWTDPPGALQALMARCLVVFPQCSPDRSTTKSQANKNESEKGVYVPHMTVAQCSDIETTMKLLEKLRHSWKGISFPVSELYFLHRRGGHPFKVEQVVPLGTGYGTVVPRAHFGPGSVPLDSREDRTVVAFGVPPGLRLKDTKYSMEYEISRRICNPDGSERDILVIEFKSGKGARDFLSRATLELPRGWGGTYFLHLPEVTFPGTVRDSCSLEEVKNQDYNYWWDTLKNKEDT